MEIKILKEIIAGASTISELTKKVSETNSNNENPEKNLLALNGHGEGYKDREDYNVFLNALTYQNQMKNKFSSNEAKNYTSTVVQTTPSSQHQALIEELETKELDIIKSKEKISSLEHTIKILNESNSNLALEQLNLKEVLRQNSISSIDCKDDDNKSIDHNACLQELDLVKKENLKILQDLKSLSKKLDLELKEKETLILENQKILLENKQFNTSSNELEAISKEKTNLTAELETMNKKNLSLKTELEYSRDQLILEKSENEKLKVELNLLLNKNEALLLENKQFKSNNESEDSIIKEKVDENEVLKNKIKDCDKKFSQFLTNEENYKKNIENLESNIHELKTLTKNLEKEKEILNQKLNFENNEENFKLNVNDFDKEKELFNSKYLDLEEEKKNLQVKVLELEEKISKQTTKVDDEDISIDETLPRSNEDNSKNNPIINDLQIKKLTRKVSQLQNQILNLEHQLQSQKQINSEIKFLIVNSRNVNEENLLELYNEAKNEIILLKNDVSSWQYRCEEIENVVEKIVMKRSLNDIIKSNANTLIGVEAKEKGTENSSGLEVVSEISNPLENNRTVVIPPVVDCGYCCENNFIV
ncbi:hypothetical protein HK099_001880, partial [Clydaea vesicula]